MDTIFKNRNRTRTSASSASASTVSLNDFSASVPYNQLPSAYPPPVAGPSTSTISLVNSGRDYVWRKEDVSAPLSNPGLNDAGTPTGQERRQEGAILPRSARRREKVRESLRRSNMTDPGGGGDSPEGGVRRATSDVSASNGLRYQPPSIILGMGRSPTPTHEFGSQSRHPYAASIHRNSDSTSIRTVSSVSSQQPILEGRYPSFSQTSLSSRHSTTTPNGRSSTSGPSSYIAPAHNLGSSMAVNRLFEEFTFPRPPDVEVENLFQQLLENRDLDTSHTQVPSISSRNSTSSISYTNIARTTTSLPVETKWQMVESDARAQWEQEKDKRRKEDELIRSGRAKPGTAGVHVKNSPEWFLKKVLNGTLTTQHLMTLNVSLRTLPLE